MRDARRLARVHRVRTLQLGLARADEARAHERVEAEADLAARIGQLAAAVAPDVAPEAGFSFAAAAHYRERLHQSAQVADARLATARGSAARAGEATLAARRDQSAVEKLIVRSEADAALRAARLLEATPAPARGKRHGPC